ncbi:MAG: bifunctional 4-hydroxy-2-oxoglutarate aldolase/2-dehydro-3-deoxy-phosphogluconate aldolase [Clostridiales bacterium]|nr:bifunctional 4-hydroxy-2-oxoglutarate aldolase/2-dehydro-3-deoxy-phosphogluconate aldolase [Clostridiales bacterium]
MFTSYFKKLDGYGIIPVVKLDSADSAVPLAKALIDGRLPIAEVTFRTDAAEESIKRMKEAYPEILLGAGTVSSPDQVKRAVAAGAEFIVSPGFNEKVVQYCVDNKIPVLPGCSTPSDIEKALSFGLTTVKFFPAEVMGGLKAIKAMAAPYVNVYFIPTGGINESNLMEYLKFKRIIACGGSWMVPDNLIRSGKFDEIKGLTEAAVKKSLGLNLGDAGVNAEGERQVTLETRSVESARRYFEQLGFRFDESTAKKDESGSLQAIRFADKFGGFAVLLKNN